MKEQLITAGRIALGASAAILAAKALGLNYPASAGIITLLSVLDTRKETLRVAARRCGAFVTAMALANGMFWLLGHRVWVFGLFLFFFYLAVHALRVKEGYSMSAVLVTHLLNGGAVSAPALANEAALFATGIFMAVAVNSYMPDKTARIRHLQRQVEDEMRRALLELAGAVSGAPSGKLSEVLDGTRRELERMEAEALRYVGNTFSREAAYFVRYVEMRTSQAELLETMAEELFRLTLVTPQAGRMAAYFAHIGETFQETNNAEGLLEELYAMRAGFQKSELPKEREEFENRAVLFHILQLMEYFLKLKKNFVKRMTEEEKKRFWGPEDIY